MKIDEIGLELLCKGKRVELYSKSYKIGEKTIKGDVIHFGESVAIIPAIQENKILLIKQFRIPHGNWIIEIPAGRIEKGETWKEAAKRELIEETGYIPHELIKLNTIFLSPGYSDEIMHIVLAKKLKYVGSRPESDELIEVIEIELDKAITKIINMPHTDAKTLLSLMIYKNFYK